MKSILRTAVLFLWAGIVSFGQSAPQDFPLLKGPYMGQTPPGPSPQLFLRTLLDRSHSSPVFTPDGNQVFWSADDIIHFMEQTDGVWTRPRHLKLIEDSELEDVPFLSADGNRLYFVAGFRGPDNPERRGIWYVDRSGRGWSAAKSVGPNINRLYGHWQFSVSARGTIYFPARVKDSEEGRIMASQRVNGQYEKAEPVFENLRTGCPFIAPDESYLVFASGYESDAFWKTQLYISFRSKNGSWTAPVNLSRKLGLTTTGQLCPIVSPDGKYLFFISGVHWVEAKIIEELRPKE